MTEYIMFCKIGQIVITSPDANGGDMGVKDISRAISQAGEFYFKPDIYSFQTNGLDMAYTDVLCS